MDSHFSRKRRRLSDSIDEKNAEQDGFIEHYSEPKSFKANEEEDDSTEIKLATLASLYPSVAQEALLDSLIAAQGSVETVCRSLDNSGEHALSKKAAKVRYQTSLTAFRKVEPSSANGKRLKPLTRKGQTLHLYAPEDIASQSPCSIIHNFLPASEADELLKELLEEAPTFERQTFKLFDNIVQSPHSACFYVNSLEEQRRQKTEYLYNGSFLTVWFFAQDRP